MLHPLLDTIATQLTIDLGGDFPASTPSASESPASPGKLTKSSAPHPPTIHLGQATDTSLPHIILRPGQLTLHSLGQADSAPPPRQTLTLDPNNPLGPHTLTYPVNRETFTIRPFDPPSSASGDISDDAPNTQPLTLDQDFTLDDANRTLTLLADPFQQAPVPYTRLLVQYAADEITILQEFQQDIWIEILAQDATTVDRLTTLTLTSLLTSQETLLTHHLPQPAAPQPTPQQDYQTQTINAQPTLRQLQLIQGDALTSGLGFQLQFRVTGQVKLSRTINETPSWIRRIDLNDEHLVR